MIGIDNLILTRADSSKAWKRWLYKGMKPNGVCLIPGPHSRSNRWARVEKGTGIRTAEAAWVWEGADH